MSDALHKVGAILQVMLTGSYVDTATVRGMSAPG